MKEKTENSKNIARNNIKNSEKAITLIALVVTIIVLIILAGVSISLVLGDNGIITKAREAKTNYQTVAQNEKTSLNELYDEMNTKITGNGSGSLSTEGYGLRADGKFYCDPASTTGKYDSGYTRVQSGMVYDSSHFYRDDNVCLYYDETTGEDVFGTVFYVWDRENGSRDDGELCDVYDSSGVFLYYYRLPETRTRVAGELSTVSKNPPLWNPKYYCANHKGVKYSKHKQK